MPRPSRCSQAGVRDAARESRFWPERQGRDFSRPPFSINDQTFRCCPHLPWNLRIVMKVSKTHEERVRPVCPILSHFLTKGWGVHSPVKKLYCSFVSGTTLSLPCRTKGDSANNLFAFTSASDTGRANVLPTLIFTRGFFASLASTSTTDAVPTALLRSPVS